jgi:hypothetical protein
MWGVRGVGAEGDMGAGSGERCMVRDRIKHSTMHFLVLCDNILTANSLDFTWLNI